MQSTAGRIKRAQRGRDVTNERLLFTTPFWTLKPNWYLVSGRLIFTSTTGGHGTTVSLTTVADFVFCHRQNSLHKVRAKCRGPRAVAMAPLTAESAPPVNDPLP